MTDFRYNDNANTYNDHLVNYAGELGLFKKDLLKLQEILHNQGIDPEDGKFNGLVEKLEDCRINKKYLFDMLGHVSIDSEQGRVFKNASYYIKDGSLYKSECRLDRIRLITNNGVEVERDKTIVTFNDYKNYNFKIVHIKSIKNINYIYVYVLNNNYKNIILKVNETLGTISEVYSFEGDYKYKNLFSNAELKDYLIIDNNLFNLNTETVEHIGETFNIRDSEQRIGVYQNTACIVGTYGYNYDHYVLTRNYDTKTEIKYCDIKDQRYYNELHYAIFDKNSNPIIKIGGGSYYNISKGLYKLTPDKRMQQVPGAGGYNDDGESIYWKDFYIMITTDEDRRNRKTDKKCQLYVIDSDKFYDVKTNNVKSYGFGPLINGILYEAEGVERIND